MRNFGAVGQSLTGLDDCFGRVWNAFNNLAGVPHLGVNQVEAVAGPAGALSLRTSRMRLAWRSLLWSVSWRTLAMSWRRSLRSLWLLRPNYRRGSQQRQPRRGEPITI